MSRKINLYACGGFGTNIMLLLLQRGIFEQLGEHVNLFALDTSQSNLKRFASDKRDSLIQKILVKNADGSGKHRAENYEAITALVTDLINDGTGDGLNILIYSASGGSGGIIGGELQDLLTQRNRTVLGMVLGTDGSKQELDNTVKTLKTLQHKAAQGTKNMTVFWGGNRNEAGKVDSAGSDQVFVATLEDLIMVGHPGNQDLDTKDIHHWLNFPIAQDTPGTVRFLSLMSRKEQEDFSSDEEVPVSALSLLQKRGIDPQFPEGTGYGTHGYIAEELRFQDDVVEVQYQVFSGRTAKLANQLQARQKFFSDIANRAAEHAAGDHIKKSSDDKVTDTGSFL